MPIIRRETDEDPDVQMTPIIDMVFLLLIFFIVTASLKKPIKVIPIELATATAAEEERLVNEVVLTVDAEGRRSIWDGKTHLNEAGPDAEGRNREAVMRVLQDLSQTEPDTPIRMDIDRRATWGSIMDLHNQMGMYGLRHVYYKSASSDIDEGK